MGEQGKLQFLWCCDGKIPLKEHEMCPTVRVFDKQQLLQFNAKKRNVDRRSLEGEGSAKNTNNQKSLIIFLSRTDKGFSTYNFKFREK